MPLVKTNPLRLAIIVPVKDEQDNIENLYRQVDFQLSAERVSTLPNLFSALEHDFWFIDDGSTDTSLSIIQKLAAKDKRVHYVSFSRNFGKEAAIYAGLKYAQDYDYLLLMDADLQDPPEMILKMIKKLVTDNLDSVAAQRIDRKGERWLISGFSKLFYRLISKISSTKLVSGARDFRIMTSQTAKAVLSLTENQRFSKGLFSWIGFKTEYVSYANFTRKAGHSKWGFWRLFKYAVTGIISFSTIPLSLVTSLGIITTILALIGGLFLIVRKILDPAVAIGGWTTITVIITFFGGLQMFSLGVVGRYIAAIFLEVKHRPIYLVKESK
ncbi:glycosyltransferase family 2 protein [Oenococcus alcoholitolerans]|uniref:glycosyltransferase family 2 protein n=1 Tax=Oenococcus alcoholitolerans TaxID=931074 RepID=UPI003F707FE6